MDFQEIDIIQKAPLSHIPHTIEGNRESDTPAFYTTNNKVYSFKEIQEMNIPEPVAIVEDLLYKKNLSILSAKPKVGKSTLARFLSSQVNSGGIFLGRKCIRSRVLYFSLEEPLFNVKRDFEAIMVQNPEDLFIINELELPTLKSIEQTVQKMKPDLVIIDTMIHATQVPDINDYYKNTAALASYRALANKNDCHIMFIHHSKKGDSSGAESVLGSSGIIGSVDLIINLDKKSNDSRAIQSVGRSGQDFCGESLNYDKNTKHFSLFPANSTNQLVDDVRREIELNPGVSQDELRVKLRKRTQSISEALSELENQLGEIYSKLCPIDGRTKRFYSLDSALLGAQ